MFFDVPTAATIRQHSRLKLEQVWTSFANTNSLDAEITVRRDRQANFVKTKLLRVITEADYLAADVDDLERRNSLVSTWVELRTLGDLMFSAGQFHSSYREAASEYWAQAREYEDAILEELDAIDGVNNLGSGTPDSASVAVRAVW